MKLVERLCLNVFQVHASDTSFLLTHEQFLNRFKGIVFQSVSFGAAECSEFLMHAPLHLMRIWIINTRQGSTLTLHTQ